MLSAFLALAVAPINFTPPPDGSTTYSLDEMSVENTSTRAEIKWHWNPPIRRKTLDFNSLACRNTCRGLVHFVHKACDRSCDNACQSAHRDTIPASRGFFTYTLATEQTMESAASMFGFNVAVGRAVMKGGLDLSGISATEQNPALAVSWNFTCWNDEPCSSARKSIEELVYRVDFEVRLFRLNRVDDKMIRTEGPLVNYHVDVSILDKDSLKPGRKTTYCRCALVPEEHASAGPVEQIPDTAVTCTEPDGDTRVCTGEEIKQMGFEVTCEDMNHATVVCTSPMETCSQIKIPAGWEFDCVDGSAQDTQLCQDLTFDCTGGQMVASLAPLAAPKPKVDAFTMCLEIKKKEPKRTIKYRLKPPSTLERLKSARLAADSRRRGIWDQVRTWIITDNATYDEIAKLLIPAPSPAMYMRELHNAHKIGAINPAMPKVTALYNNDLLTTPGVEAEPMTDFLRVKLNYDRAATMKWIRASAAQSFADWFAENPARVVAPALNTFVEAFTSAGDDGLLAVAEMIASPALAPHLESLEGEGVFNLAVRLAAPADPKLAEAIVVALEKSRHPSAQFAALNAHKSLSAGLKKRLEAAAGKQ